MYINDHSLNFVQKQLSIAKEKSNQLVVDNNNKLIDLHQPFFDIRVAIENFEKKGSEPRVIIIPGFRGVGKTTLLAQLYLYLYGKKNNQEDILFFSMDDFANTVGGKLQDIISTYEYILKRNFETLNKKIYLIIDEIQFDEKWDLSLKTLIDKSKNIFIICSGSSAIKLKISPDLARRSIIKRKFPLSFKEFQASKNNHLPALEPAIIKHKIFNSDSASEIYKFLNSKKNSTELNLYWSKIETSFLDSYIKYGTFPFTYNYSSEIEIFQVIRQLIETVLQKDIPNISRLNQTTLLQIQKLIFILAESEDILSKAKIADTLGVNHQTIDEILEALIKAEVLFKALPYGKNLTKVKKPSKLLFSSPAIRLAYLDLNKVNAYQIYRGRLLEDIFTMYIYKEFLEYEQGLLCYDPEEGGADFILELFNQKSIVFEICAGNKKEIKQVKQTMKKTNANLGIIFHNGELKLYETENIIKIPLKFLFSI